MRIVVNASFWPGNVVGHSISLSSIATAKALSSLPNVHVILPMPKNRDLWVYKDSDLEDIDQVVEVEYMDKFMTHFNTEDWWNHFNVGSGGVFYDVMLEANAKIALQMKNWAMVGNRTSKFFLPAPMTVTNVLRPAFLIYELKRRQPEAHLLETLAQMTMPTMFLTEYQKEVALYAARSYLAPAQIRDIDERSVVIPNSIDVTRIQYKLRYKPDKIRIMFGTTLSAVKNADVLGVMYDKIVRLGKPVEVVVSLPFRKEATPDRYTVDVVGELKDKAYAIFGKNTELYVAPPRDVYERLLEGADVFVCMSYNESFGISYFEQLQAGQVGIYWKRPWQKGILPKEYPFVCETEEEVYARLLWVIDNLEEAQKRVAFVKEWIPQNLSRVVVANRMEQFIRKQFNETLEKDREVMSKQWLYQCLESTLKRGVYSMEELARIVKERKKTNIFAPSTQYVHTVRRMMQLLGFEDTLNKTGLPMFKRREG